MAAGLARAGAIGDKHAIPAAGKQAGTAAPISRSCRGSRRILSRLIRVTRMSLVANTAPHLPYLRRFARALTGGQKSGDAYVISVLEALVADPDSFNPDNDPRVELFKAFCRYWNSIEVNLAKDEYSPDELDGA